MGKRRVEVEIIGDAKSLERAFGRASKSSGMFAKSMQFGAAVGGIAVVGQAFRAAFNEMLDAERVAADTKAVLKSTGGVAGVTAKQVDALAQAVSNYSGIDDEAVAQSENLLLTFTKIRNEVGEGNDIFNQATKAVADMSTRMGGDLKGAALQVGKALNDPVKGVTALQRAGVSFTKQQKDQIKSLVESGKTMQAQKLVLRELNTEFGGAARAAGDTLAGKLSKARNALAEAGATILGVAAPAIEKFAVGLQVVALWLGQHVPAAWTRMRVAGQAAVNWFTTNLLPTIQATVDRVRAVWRFMGDDIMRVAGTVFRNIVNVVRPALQTVVGAIRVVAALIRGDWSALWGAVKQMVSGALRTVVAVIRGAASNALAAARFVGTMIWQGVKNGVQKLVQLGADLIRLIGSAIKSAASAAVTMAVQLGADMIRGVISGVQSMAGALRDKVVSVVTAPLNWAKGALKIFSPSRVYAKEVGEPIVDGVVMGLNARAPKITVAIDKILRGMKGKFSAQTRLSIAELTFGTDDDVKALRGVVKAYERAMVSALRSRDQEKIREAAGNLKGARDQLVQLQGDRRDSRLQAAVDMAKLTSGTGDDVRALRAMEKSLVARLAEATRRKDYSGQSQIAQALLGLRGELSGLTPSAGGGVTVNVGGGQGFDSTDPRQLAASISWWMRAASVGAVA